MMVHQYDWVQENSRTGQWVSRGIKTLFEIDEDMAVAWDRDMADVPLELYRSDSHFDLYMTCPVYGYPESIYPIRLAVHYGYYQYWKGKWSVWDTRYIPSYPIPDPLDLQGDR